LAKIGNKVLIVSDWQRKKNVNLCRTGGKLLLLHGTSVRRNDDAMKGQ